MGSSKDIKHLLRLAVVMAVAVIGFVILRGAVVPRTFGQYGHYRGKAITEIAARPISYAGHQVCETCHSEVADQKDSGSHAHVACEACHGALARHAEDPASVQPKKLDTAVLCRRCHEGNSAKPKGFPQVATADHSSGLPCETCHQPHSPKIETEGKK